VKLNGVDPVLGPEMKSTGEVLGLGRSFEEAAGKAFAFKDNLYGDWQKGELVIVSLADGDKQEELGQSIGQLQKDGAVLVATPGTASWLEANGVAVSHVVTEESQLTTLLQKEKAAFALVTATKGNRPGRTGFALRSRLVQQGVQQFFSVDTFDLYVKSIMKKRGGSHAACEDIGTLSKLTAQQA